VEGIISAGLVNPQEMVVYDQDTDKTAGLQAKLGLMVAQSLPVFCQDAKKIFISVKPQDIPKLLLSIKPCLNANHLLVSVAAGLKIKFYQDYLGKEQKIIRLMPNTPSLVGEGMIVACKSESVSSEEEETVLQLLKPLGKVLPLEEAHFDAVTALSGSGPAYIYLVIEALIDGGVAVGLSRDVAQLLVSQTVFGAAKMVLTTGLHPAVLKSQVTSPGGITCAALLALEDGNIRAAIAKAVIVGASRSKEMGNQN